MAPGVPVPLTDVNKNGAGDTGVPVPPARRGRHQDTHFGPESGCRLCIHLQPQRRVCGLRMGRREGTGTPAHRAHLGSLAGI